MTLWALLTGGDSLPQRTTWGSRFALWCGYLLAARHRRVRIDRTCRISPEARICPRQGAIEIGAHTSVALGALLQGNIRIGEHCSVQAHSLLVGYGRPGDTSGRITIGNYVRIAPMVMMIAADHIFADPGRPIHSQGLHQAPIIIEDDVWIAGRVSVVAGVTIGRGSVIGAGAVVTHDIPPYSVAVGVPARVVRNRLRPGRE